MPTRTISAAGGNWNATGTWVGSVVPIAGDDIIGDATSGNLTINVNTANMRSFDFRNYTNTITLNGLMNLGTTAPATSTFSATMSFATSIGYSEQACINLTNTLAGNTVSIVSNGLKLPFLRSIKSSGVCHVNLLDELNCTTLAIGKGNANVSFYGTYSIKINNFIRSEAGGGNVGVMRMPLSPASATATGGKLIFVGPTASYLNLATTDATVFEYMMVEVDTGTFSTNGVLCFNGVADTNTQGFKWISGTLTGDKELQLFSHARSDGFTNETRPIRLDIAGSGTWSQILYQPWCRFTTPEPDVRLHLDSDLFFDEMIMIAPWINPIITGTLRRPLSVLGGSGALKGGRIIDLPMPGVNNLSPTSSLLLATYSTPIIKLSSGPTHSFSDIHVFGHDTGLDLRNSDRQASRNAWIRSTTNSVAAKINYTGSQNEFAFYTYFQDIDASSGNPIYVFGGGQSGSTNIQAITIGGSTATGGTKAFTYIN